MKKNDINDLKTKSVDELKRLLIDTRGELLKLAHEGSLSQVKNTNAVKNAKKKVARILTFLHMKNEAVKMSEEVKEVIASS